MSDNSQEPEIIALQIEVQDQGAQESLNQEAAALERIQNMMNTFYAEQTAAISQELSQLAAERDAREAVAQVVSDAMQRIVAEEERQIEVQQQLNEAAQVTAVALQATADAEAIIASNTADTIASTKELADAVVSVGQAYTTADERLQQYMNDVEASSQAQGPTATDFGGGEDGGGGGSLYGVARGFRAGGGIGRLVGAGPETTAGFTGIADLIYLQQGLNGLQVAAAAAGLGVAELIAVMTPIAVAVGAFVLVMNDLNERSKEATESAKAFGEALKAAIPTTIGGTQTDVQVAQAKATQDVIIQNAEKEAELNEIRRKAAAAGTEMGTAISKLSDEQILHSSLLQKTYAENFKTIDAATSAAQKDADVQKILADATTSATVAANTAAEQARQLAADHVSQQSKYAADDKASSQADQDKVESLYGSITAQQEAVAGLEANNATLDKTSEAYLKNQQAIDGYNKSIADEQAEITHITSISQGLAEKREALTAADTQYLGMLDQEIAQSKRRTEDEALTSQANADKTAKLREDRDVTQSAIDALTQHSIVTDADQKKLDQLTSHLQDLDTELNDLTNAFNPAKIREAADAIQKAQEAYDKTIQSAQDSAVSSIANATATERQAEQQYTEGSIQDTYKRQQVATTAERDIEKARLDSANKIQDSYANEGDAETKIVNDYLFQQQEDQIKNAEAMTKLQTDARNTALNDALTHAEKLADIQKQSNQNILQDIEDRNFQQLAKDQQGKKSQVDKENEAYQDQLTLLQQRLQQQEEAQAVSFSNEEARRKRDEEKKYADEENKAEEQRAQLAINEQRKEQEIARSEQQKLQDITTSEREQIAVLRLNLVNRITLIQIEENQREQIAAQTQAAIVANAKASISSMNQDFSTQLSQLNQLGKNGPAPTPSTYYNSNNPGTYAGSTPASPVISQPVQQAQQGFDVSSIIGAIANGVQGFFNL